MCQFTETPPDSSTEESFVGAAFFHSTTGSVSVPGLNWGLEKLLLWQGRFTGGEARRIFSLLKEYRTCLCTRLELCTSRMFCLLCWCFVWMRFFLAGLIDIYRIKSQFLVRSLRCTEWMNSGLWDRAPSVQKTVIFL